MNAYSGRASRFDAEMSASTPSLAVETSDLSVLRDLMKAILRSWFPIMLAALLCGAALTLATFVRAPTYVASAQVMLNTRTQSPNAIALPTGTLALSITTLESEIDLMRSNDVLMPVVEELGLASDPRFVGDEDGFNIRRAIRSLILGGDADEGVGDPSFGALESLSENLKVTQNGPVSAVYTISFEAESPELAATIANAVAKSYVDLLLARKLRAISRAQRWFEDRAVALNAKVGEIATAYEQHRLKEPATAATIEALRTERTTLLEQPGDHTAAFAEIDARLAVYAAYVSELKRLERELEEARTVHGEFVEQAQRTTEPSLYLDPEATIISRALAPDSPAGLSRAITLIVGLMLGGMMGVGGAVTGELLNTRLRKKTEIETAAEAPILGVFPKIRTGLRLRTPDDVAAALKRSASRFGGRLLQQLEPAKSAAQPVLAIASPSARDGRTTVGKALAQVFVDAGYRTLYVDCSGEPDARDAPAAGLETALAAPSEGAAYLVSLTATAGRDRIVLPDSRTVDMKALREAFGAIILESPPMNAEIDAAATWQLADGVIAVVKWNGTTRQELQRLSHETASVGAPLVGVVVNATDKRRLHRYCDEMFVD